MKNISFVVLVLIAALILASCNDYKKTTSNITTDINIQSNTDNRTAFKLEEFYESSEFQKYGYEWINAINYNGNDLLISGSKNLNSGKKCLILTEKSDEYKILNLDVDYSSVKDACLVGDTMFVLHDDKVSCININTGEIKYQKVISYSVSVIQKHDDNFILKDFAGDTLYFYDQNFDFIKKTETADFLNINFDIENVRLLGTKDRIYIAGDIEGIITLFVLNNDYEVIFSKKYSDLPGMAYQIYDDGTNIVLISNESINNPDTYEYTICSYIDILNYSDGTVEQMYEIQDAQFVFWNFYNSDIISKHLEEIYIRNLETNSKSKFSLPENYIVQRVVQSSDNIIFFEDYEEEIVPCITYVSEDGVTNEYKLDLTMNNIQFTKDNNIVYSIAEENTDITTVVIKENDFKTIKKIQLESSTINNISESVKIEYCENKIYSFIYDTENNLWTIVYDSEGKILNEYMNDFSIVYKLLNNGNSLYAVYDKYIDDCGISEITDTGDIPLSAFCNLDINNYYSGDEKYSLYYAIGSVVYGYDYTVGISSRILNYYDSGISNIESMFIRISDSNYLCDINEGNNIKYIQLTKADDETVRLLNERKIIVAAGDTVYWGDALSKAIVDFNRASNEYYISTKDYSKSFDSGLNQFQNDIIKGDIPDLFISGGTLDTKILERNNAFENLGEYIENSKIIFEDFYPKDTKNGGVYYVSPVIGFGVIENNNILSGLESGVSTSEFLENAKKFDLKFSGCTRYQIFDYLVVDNIDDYVDYTNKECRFKSDEFIELIEYIKNSESDEGELKLKIYNNFYELIDFSEEKSYFDVSADGLYSSHINENIRMSVYSNSDYKEAIWEFIESVFNSGEQILAYGLPVCQDINGVNYYDSYAVGNDKIFSLLENGKVLIPSDLNIQNVLYSELDAFFDGEISAREYAENVNNHIMLYLAEL